MGLTFEQLIQHFTDHYARENDEATKAALGKVVSTLWERNSVEYARIEIERLQKDVQERIEKLSRYEHVYQEFLLNTAGLHDPPRGGAEPRAEP